MSKFVVAGYLLTTTELCPRIASCTVFKRYKSRSNRGLILSTLRTHPLLGLKLHLKRKAKTVYTCPVISSTIQVLGRVSGFTRTSVAGCFWRRRYLNYVRGTRPATLLRGRKDTNEIFRTYNSLLTTYELTSKEHSNDDTITYQASCTNIVNVSSYPRHAPTYRQLPTQEQTNKLP